MSDRYDAPTFYEEIIHTDDRARVLTRLHELPKAGVFEEEFRIVRPDGQVRWVFNRGFVVRTNSGDVNSIVGVAQDTTERKYVEDALRQSEAAYLCREEWFENLEFRWKRQDGTPITVLASGRFVRRENEEFGCEVVVERTSPNAKSSKHNCVNPKQWMQ